MFQVASAGGAEALGAGQPEGLGGWWRGLREILVMCEAVGSLSLRVVWAAKRTRLFWKGNSRRRSSYRGQGGGTLDVFWI